MEDVEFSMEDLQRHTSCEVTRCLKGRKGTYVLPVVMVNVFTSCRKRLGPMIYCDVIKLWITTQNQKAD
jgi:hypothetical protein